MNAFKITKKNTSNFDSSLLIKSIKKRRLFAALLIFVIIPLMFFVFYGLFHKEHYVIMSFIVLGFVLILFLMLFEYRALRARDTVLIATMIALTVAANVICTHTVPLHAGTALVVISGITLGPEAGLVVGVLGRLIFNRFDGQGPWTPWQMVSWGIMGYIAGMVFNHIDVKADSIFNEVTVKRSDTFKVILAPVTGIVLSEAVGIGIFFAIGQIREFFGYPIYLFGFLGLLIGAILQRKKLPTDLITMTVFTFFVTFIIYGGIMNLANMLMLNILNSETAKLNIDTLRAVFITGVPYDAQHALGAALCCFFFGEGLVKKIERIRIKFGILI